MDPETLRHRVEGTGRLGRLTASSDLHSLREVALGNPATSMRNGFEGAAQPAGEEEGQGHAPGQAQDEGGEGGGGGAADDPRTALDFLSDLPVLDLAELAQDDRGLVAQSIQRLHLRVGSPVGGVIRPGIGDGQDLPAEGLDLRYLTPDRPQQLSRFRVLKGKALHPGKSPSRLRQPPLELLPFAEVSCGEVVVGRHKHLQDGNLKAGRPFDVLRHLLLDGVESLGEGPEPDHADGDQGQIGNEHPNERQEKPRTDAQASMALHDG